MVVYAGWDEYMFKQHKRVAVDPCCSAGEVELLNVFTKAGTYGIVNRGPNLEYTGGLTNLAHKGSSDQPQSSTAAPAALVPSLNDVLQTRKSKNLPEVLATFKATSRILASVLKIFSAESTDDRSLTVKIESITSEFINQDDLAALVNQGTWKPDLNNSQLPKNWDGVLWVVKEIMYATKLIIGQSSKSVQSASLRPKSLVPVPATPDLASLDCKKSTDGTTVYTARGKGRFPVGFMAVRLEYDQSGNLLGPDGIKFGLGDQRPKVRADADAWLDPDSEPEFHMRGLFSQQPGQPLECLQMLQWSPDEILDEEQLQ